MKFSYSPAASPQLSSYIFALICIVSSGHGAIAQTLPSSADSSRINPSQAITSPLVTEIPMVNIQSQTKFKLTPPPENSDQIHLEIKEIKIVGGTVYSEQKYKDIYKDYINKDITLDKIWLIADQITSLYMEDGYFLSRAYIPKQEINDGIITIQIVEGYIQNVEIDPNLRKEPIIQKIVGKILSQKPISIKHLVHYNLLLTDMPGLKGLQGVLAPAQNANNGGIQLIYKTEDQVSALRTSSFYTSIDNFGSRYLGPLEMSVGWSGQIVPFQDTSISTLVDLPVKEIKAINISHRKAISSYMDISLNAGYTTATPGYLLKVQDIESRSLNMGVNLSYKIIRDREKNWSANIGFDARNSDSELLSTTLSEDRIRVMRLSTTYTSYDGMNGYNTALLRLSQGLNGLGSNDSDDINISRDGASPDFTKLELEYSRYQKISDNYASTLNIKAQKASGSMYSSEEFGYGGQDAGRAYDQSEITGDDGISLSTEVMYNGISEALDTKLQPYIFFDTGKVWNKNSGQQKIESASSTGLGVRFQCIGGANGLLQLAIPLNRPIDTPLYGSSPKSAQLGFKVGYEF